MKRFFIITSLIVFLQINTSFAVTQTEVQNDIRIIQKNEEIKLSLNEKDINVNLAVLRLNYPGINPEFNKNIKEYYLIVDNTVNNLEVEAFAEDNQATVTISGNENLKNGKNTINISVQSKDKSKIENYKIYVTKTDNIESANANLEILAIKEGTLNPEFDKNITNYDVELANNIEKVQVLAIPQNENATVEISVNTQKDGAMQMNLEDVTVHENMKIDIGDNKLQIIVLAPDGITTKKYEVNIHRRNDMEESQDTQEQEIQAQRLSAILSGNEIGSGNIENILEKENNVWFVVFTGIGILGIITFVIINKRSK